MYFYEGCKDPPEKLTGDCYPKRLEQLRAEQGWDEPPRRVSSKAARRKALGLTQVQLSKLLDVSASLISDFETGRYQGGYSNGTWKKLCEVYGESLLDKYRTRRSKVWGRNVGRCRG